MSDLDEHRYDRLDRRIMKHKYQRTAYPRRRRPFTTVDLTEHLVTGSIVFAAGLLMLLSQPVHTGTEWVVVAVTLMLGGTAAVGAAFYRWSKS